MQFTCMRIARISREREYVNGREWNWQSTREIENEPLDFRSSVALVPHAQYSTM